MLKPYRTILFTCLLVAFASFALGFMARRHTAGNPGARLWLASLADGRGLGTTPSHTFALVLENLEDSFVDRISDEKPLTYGALRQMMDELDDPNSRFLDPAETRDMLDAEDGLFHGIGAIVNIEATRTKDGERRKAVVAGVLPGGPADSAGLRPGDVIAKIDDKWVYEPRTKLKVAARGEAVTDASPTEPEIPEDAEVEDFLVYATHDILAPLGRDGRDVRLLLLGPDAKSLERVTVTTAPTSVRAPRTVRVADEKSTSLTKAPARIAEIRIPAFTRTTGPDIDAALAEARKGNANRVVLDLRGCVGGQMERALQVAGRFMDGPVGTVERRQNGRMVRVPLTAKRVANAWTGPLAVLVDRGTLGSAELLAGALAARGRAELVGTRTFGDGTEQTLIPLRDGSSLMMTTGKFFTTKGESFQAKGITPGTTLAGGDSMPVARAMLARKG